MISSDDLTLSEFDAFWSAAPKFPSTEQVDVDGFEQIWRDISDLFEDDDMLMQSEDVDEVSEVEREDDEDEEEEEQELSIIFKEISRDNYLDLQTIKEWEEVKNLLEENLISEKELEELWKETPKAPGSENRLDVEGFLSFNLALDDLFYFDDLSADKDGEEEEEEDEDSGDLTPEPQASVPVALSVPPDTPKIEVYGILTGKDDSVEGITFDDLERWADLKAMVDEGEVEVEELEEIFEGVCSEKGLLDEKAFLEFDAKVEDLFEDDDDDSLPFIPVPVPVSGTKTPAAKTNSQDKESLLSLISSLSSSDPAGLNADDPPSNLLPLISALASSPSNLLTTRPVTEKDLAGKWTLIYSNSGMIKFSQGLTGLASTLPNGSFLSLTQTLTHNSYASDCLYAESISAGAGSVVSATVDGDWNLRSSVSLLTGEPCVIVNVEPLNVKHSGTTTRADHWKSVRCMNMLNLDYIDGDLRIMRGNTSLDTVFVWKKEEE
ncbi:hypothetical protein TrST_g6694 [Triparma strigata]|uniref:Plastid lipid-associated protein/fibrillin conserved domain-containing protein n=1 Tax=Triparma strigata TaxID=1606541 RepID=A0A9W7A1Q3_9STRA|nr:hypothetical protein TrST_g6694 [Triparma strigata]